MSDVTYKVGMSSTKASKESIRAFQDWMNDQMRLWDVEYAVEEDGVWSPADRSLLASICHGLGVQPATEFLAKGVTPEIRVKLRNKRLTPDEVRRHREAERDWLPGFRRRHRDRNVSTPVTRILQDSWGYHPGVHDGIDIITPARAAGLAICKSKVVRVDDSWWGLGSPGGELADRGDGIVIIRALETIGPIKKGMNVCYGHAERPKVRVGETVEPGEVICEAGFANAWHFHWMINRGDHTRGIGDMNPREILDYVRRND
jgi:murein DD-endopeptidase MepM/ murein hydrolase activator NlpD